MWTVFLLAAVRRVCRYVHTRMSSAMISVRISSARKHWMKSSSTTSCLHRTVERFRRALLSRSSMPHWNIFLGHTGDKDTGVFRGWQTGSAQLMPTTGVKRDNFDYDYIVIASQVSGAALYLLSLSLSLFKKAVEARRLGPSQHAHPPLAEQRCEFQRKTGQFVYDDDQNSPSACVDNLKSTWH